MAAGVSRHDFGDLHAGGSLGTQSRTGYDRLDGDFKLEMDTGDSSRLTFALQQATVDDAWRTHRTVFGTSWRGTTVGNEQRRSLDQYRSLAYGIGLKFRARRSAFEVAAFETDIQDLIVRVPTGRIIEGDDEVTKTNGSDGFSRGLEVNATGRLSRAWQLRADIA